MFGTAVVRRLSFGTFGAVVVPKKILPSRLMARTVSSFKAEYASSLRRYDISSICASQTKELIGLLQKPPTDEKEFFLNLLTNHVASYDEDALAFRLTFLTAVAKCEIHTPSLSPKEATEILVAMSDSEVDCVPVLVELLDHPKLAEKAADGLSKTSLMFDSFHEVETKAKNGNKAAKRVIQSWADAEWFLQRPAFPEKVTVTVFKASRVMNAIENWMFPTEVIRDSWVNSKHCAGKLRQNGFPLAYVCSTVTSAYTILHTGRFFDHKDESSNAAVCIGGVFCTSTRQALEDSGALPLEMPVDKLNTGDVIDIYPYEGVARSAATGAVLATFDPVSALLVDKLRAGGWDNLLSAKFLTARARASLGLTSPSPRYAFDPLAHIADPLSTTQLHRWPAWYVKMWLTRMHPYNFRALSSLDGAALTRARHCTTPTLKEEYDLAGRDHATLCDQIDRANRLAIFLSGSSELGEPKRVELSSQAEFVGVLERLSAAGLECHGSDSLVVRFEDLLPYKTYFPAYI